MSNYSEDRGGRILWTLVTIVLVVVLGGMYGAASWTECRRVHPAWYCAGVM